MNIELKLLLFGCIASSEPATLYKSYYVDEHNVVFRRTVRLVFTPADCSADCPTDMSVGQSAGQSAGPVRRTVRPSKHESDCAADCPTDSQPSEHNSDSPTESPRNYANLPVSRNTCTCKQDVNAVLQIG